MSSPPLKIGVIGSGISGLSAAWLLSEKHDVTLFEKDDRFGGHSHTVTVDEGQHAIAVDTGFIVYNEATYPNLVALFHHFSIPVKPTSMSFSVSLNNGKTEYAGTNLNTLFAQRKQLVSPSFWKMLWEIRRFYANSTHWLSALSSDVTLGNLLSTHRFSQRFIHEHILPMGAAIWSTPSEKMLQYPALAFLQFCQNHGLLQFTHRPQWLTVDGGSQVYVNTLINALGQQALSSRCVKHVDRQPECVLVTDHQGDQWEFDHVVMATHADTALSLINAPDEQEKAVLGAFRYQRNTAVLHSDERMMPISRRAWASWNYLGGGQDSGPCVTYWMNKLQYIKGRPMFVSLNPQNLPAENQLHGIYSYDHPVFTSNTRTAQHAIWYLQGKRRTWFCGAHLGHGFHEDGLQAGLAVAEMLGGVKRPWQVANASGRLQQPEQGQG